MHFLPAWKAALQLDRLFKKNNPKEVTNSQPEIPELRA
jgi:hypothetical protein